MLWKIPNSERTVNCRAMGHKKMDSSINFQSKSLCFDGDNFLFSFFFNFCCKKNCFWYTPCWYFVWISNCSGTWDISFCNHALRMKDPVVTVLKSILTPILAVFLPPWFYHLILFSFNDFICEIFVCFYKREAHFV